MNFLDYFRDNNIMNNCNDCGTLLKHLFGRAWYCPNDCDKKSDKLSLCDTPKETRLSSSKNTRTNIPTPCISILIPYKPVLNLKGVVSPGNIRYADYVIHVDKHTIIENHYFFKCNIIGKGNFTKCTFDRCSASAPVSIDSSNNTILGRSTKP